MCRATVASQPSEALANGIFNERHYIVQEIAEMWQLSTDSVQRLFRDEPGVFVLSRSSPYARKRRYETLRIPESVLIRVHKKWANS